MYQYMQCRPLWWSNLLRKYYATYFCFQPLRNFKVKIHLVTEFLKKNLSNQFEKTILPGIFICFQAMKNIKEKIPFRNYKLYKKIPMYFSLSSTYLVVNNLILI